MLCYHHFYDDSIIIQVLYPAPPSLMKGSITSALSFALALFNSSCPPGDHSHQLFRGLVIDGRRMGLSTPGPEWSFAIHELFEVAFPDQIFDLSLQVG